MTSALLDNFADDALATAVSDVIALSPFFEKLIDREPLLAREALLADNRRLDRAQLRQRYAAFVGSGDDLALMLRRLRRREMMRIVFRDLSGRADLFETMAELSHLADFCVQAALAHCYRQAVARYGEPRSPEGRPENMIVLGMGKLGAFELNLSSDVDLVFFYTSQGQIQLENGGSLSHREFFLRLARQVIACLDDTASTDRVFRVDMRLRPYGDSGPLVLHRAAMEKYYSEEGRDWERYAFIKARVVAGDFALGADFLAWMRPFIYRRYLDYGAIQSLREMKALIARQVELKAMHHDLKLGPGGIREVEFVAQGLQLVWGGRHPELREPGLIDALSRLAEHDFMPEADVALLQAAYVFLRDSEHAVQAEHDRQTHALPEDEVSRRRLAKAMGYDAWEDYLAQLQAHRDQVTRCFNDVVSGPQRDGDSPVDDAWDRAWAQPEQEQVAALKREVERLQLDAGVADALDGLMPRLLQAAAATGEPALALNRFLPVITAVLRRSTYLLFLIANPDAMRRAVELLALSPWLAEQLEAYPILLYDLTDRAVRKVAVSKKALEGQLREAMRVVDAGDLEIQMDTLRQFKLTATMKIAAMELLHEITLMEASDGLTALAEVILDTCVDLAWAHLENRHGLPCDEAGNPLRERLAVIAYGKAGGLELAYGSDLDLVFLCPDYIRGGTDGRQPVNNNMFYVRLGQRIIHILTSFTRFGILYSVDVRLRPQGNNGPLVATVSAFERYQDKDAWTWEHQALIRARFVAGDPRVGQRFEQIRRRVISRPRDPDLLLGEVLAMREKMRRHLASPAEAAAGDGSAILGAFDLKHDAGAIVDIEFMVQYAVLARASGIGALSRWTDVMRLLDELISHEVFTEPEVINLQRAYLTFRAAVHREWLGLALDFERLQTHRAAVRRIWLARMRDKTG